MGRTRSGVQRADVFERFLRYYLYISNAKVDMLLPQVPGAVQRKVSTKFGFDIKVLSGSLAAERATLDNRISRLLAVEGYLLESESVGAPDQETSWIRGTVDAKFVDIGDDALLFLTRNPSGILALGGSAHHLVGASAPERVGIPISFLPGMTKRLVQWADQHPEMVLRSSEHEPRRPLAPEISEEFTLWKDVIKWALDYAKAETQKIEFLAKRLVTSVEPRETFTLASPLFVSSAD